MTISKINLDQKLYPSHTPTLPENDSAFSSLLLKKSHGLNHNSSPPVSVDNTAQKTVEISNNPLRYHSAVSDKKTLSLQAIKEESLNPILKLGKINQKESPTVSHLLKNNLKYSHNFMKIIRSEANHSKPFKYIKDGTMVSLNTETNELIWKGDDKIRQQAVNLAGTETKINSNDQVVIGVISKDSPTVSNLLKNNDIYRNETWDIVFSPVNKSKPFSLLTPGTQVSLDPQTLELSFLGKNSIPYQNSENISVAAKLNLNDTANYFFDENKTFSERLADSVKSYIGKPYKEIDCYGLLVRGIKNQGVQYNGKGGLRESMEMLAEKQGLPGNAFLNGEGLVQTAGQSVFDKSYLQIENSHSQAKSVFNEIQPKLKEGMILSFSTPSRGHTGIVSKKNDMWTYINSGLIDNQVEPGRITRRVGEEVLEEELKNWFVLAKGRHESLKISMGYLDEEKVRNYSSQNSVNLLSKADL